VGKLFSVHTKNMIQVRPSPGEPETLGLGLSWVRAHIPMCLATAFIGYTPNRAGKRVSSKGGEVRWIRDFDSREGPRIDRRGPSLCLVAGRGPCMSGAPAFLL
jgi:hypothetical protein